MKDREKKKEIRQVIKQHSVYVKAAAVFLIAAVGCVCVYMADNSAGPEKDEAGNTIVRRSGYGEGEETDRFRVQIGNMQEEIEVYVSERNYTEEEIREIFARAEGQLEELILGENESLEEVRSDLDLISELPDTGVKITWEVGNYDVMDLQGKLNEENLTEEGTLVKLTARLSYGEEKAAFEFYVRVFPPRMSSEEKLLRELDGQIKAAEEASREEESFVLPDSIQGRKIEWDNVPDTRAFGLLLLGAGAAVMLCISEKEKKKQQMKKKILYLKLDYPQILNKFNLYLSAGMTVRKAWFRIARDYESSRKRTGERPAYKEMVYTMHQIQGGGAEAECYENFGARCGISSYRKFGTMLSQNLRKGSKGLTELLRREAEEAFEERKNQAKKAGDEAGTKLMLPMFLMLAVVFIIVTVPAFFSIQI